MPFDVFISHSSADKKIAEDLCAGLEKAGLRCWIAPRNVTGGLDYADQISEALQECPATLLVFSSHSNESRHVKAEIDAAFGNGKILMPLRIEAVPPTKGMAHYLRNTHWLDALGTPTPQHIAHVAETLKSLIAGAPPPQIPANLVAKPQAPKGKGISPIAIVAGVALLVVVAAVAMMFMPRSKPEPSTTASTPAASTPSTAGSTPTPEGEATPAPVSPEYAKIAGSFAHAHLALADVDQAREAFDASSELDEKLAENLAAAYLKNGDRDSALEVLAGNGDPKKAEQYKIAQLEARGKALKQALATLKAAEETGRVDGLDVDTRIAILQAAVHESSSAGLDTADFDTLLSDAADLASKDDTWEGVARQLRVAEVKAAHKDVEGANTALQALEKEYLTGTIDQESAPAVAEALRVYLIQGDLAGAEALYAKLEFKSGADVAMLPLVEALIAADPTRLADAEKLAFSGENPQSQQLVVQGYIDEEDLDAAVKAAENENATGLALPVLIGNALLEAEDPEKGEPLLQKARAIAANGASKYEKAKGLAEIAAIEATAGYETAEKTLAEAKAMIGGQ